jgi:hypothetical protein
VADVGPFSPDTVVAKEAVLAVFMLHLFMGVLFRKGGPVERGMLLLGMGEILFEAGELLLGAGELLLGTGELLLGMGELTLWIGLLSKLEELKGGLFLGIA